MAISNLLPRKAGNGSARAVMQARIEYDLAEEKTGSGAYVTSYMCSPESAAAEFEAYRNIYAATTGRRQSEERDIIAYRIIQSFAPGEITPEEANKLGYELAMKFTKGKHQFIVATHVDKAHIHNHVEFNSVNLDCDGKFNNFKNSSLALRRLNDEICREHGYSVIEQPRGKAKTYQETAAAKRGRSHKERLRMTIDRVLSESRDFEDFLARMWSEGYEIKRRGKSLEFRDPEQDRFTRSFRLGDAYTEEALRERIAGTYKGAGALSQKEKEGTPTRRETSRMASKSKQTVAEKRVNLLVDIQAKLAQGKGKGYEKWAKVFNLKEAAKTLNFLTESGVTDYGELTARTEVAGERFDALAVKIKQLEGRMAEISELKQHIFDYSKTRDIYGEYKKARYSPKYRAEHEDEITRHEAAKAAFDALKGKPIPKVAELNRQLAALRAEKREVYEEYKAARKELIEYRTALQNVDKILGIELKTKDVVPCELQFRGGRKGAHLIN